MRKKDENPYLAARRQWNEHVSGETWSRRIWQLVAIISMMTTLAAVGGLISVSQQSKYIPFVYEVDSIGNTNSIGPLTASSPSDRKVIKAALATFIDSARMVTPDLTLQKKAIYRVFAHIPNGSAAFEKMRQWYNSTDDNGKSLSGDPRSSQPRASTETVETNIVSILSLSESTWQVEWDETVRARDGTIKTKATRWRAVLTTRVSPPTNQTTEEQLRRNPAGVYIEDFSWTKVTR